jgi:hypothetical protein
LLRAKNCSYLFCHFFIFGDGRYDLEFSFRVGRSSEGSKEIRIEDKLVGKTSLESQVTVDVTTARGRDSRAFKSLELVTRDRAITR